MARLHPADPDPATGLCRVPGCERRTRWAGVRWEHSRGFAGKGITNPRTRPHHDRTRSELKVAHDRIRLLEEDNARLRELAHPFVGIHARLDRIERLLRRDPPTHRRIADGGIGGRRERRRRDAA